MTKIFFTKDINKVIASELGPVPDALVVYHDMYPKPEIEAQQVIEWSKYRGVYSETEASRIILIGLNRMINPANRCDFIHDYLTTLTPNIPKMVIDTSPFIGEPWRLFYHYLFANCNKFGFNYSYPIEGEWKKWFLYETNECRLSASSLPLFITDTYSDLTPLTTSYDLHVPDDAALEWYGEARGQIFEKYSSPKMWVTHLLALSNKHFNLKIDFDSYLTNEVFVVPDMGVYRFVVEENRRRQGIYNCFTKK
jgi:hypothetical protein